MRAIIVHGGAWDIPKEMHKAHLEGCSAALDAGYDELRTGSAMDAVVEAVSCMEADCTFDAGCGSFLNQIGEVEMDAMVMSGRDLRMGSVAAVRGIEHPVQLARMVMDGTEHCMLVGEGAVRFAQEKGFELIPSEDLVSPRELARWQMSSKNGGFQPRKAFGRYGGTPSDTVGAVALDEDGDIAVATSTGGTPGKMPGRVGDSPLVGCGTYADNETAGVSATGYGEALMKICMARSVCESVRAGMSAEQAAHRSVEVLRTRVDGLGGVIVLRRNGSMAHAFNTPHMAVGSIDVDGKRRLLI